MSQWPRARALAAALLAAALVERPVTEADANHFAWLGHTPCPWDAAQCETRVPPGFRSLGDFSYEFFHIVDEAGPEWRGEPPTETLRTRDGQIIAKVGRAFRHELEAQGSGRLRDGRIVNAEEQIGGQWRYLVVRKAPFGLSAPGYKLVPYRTAGVNPKRIRLGTVLYVPALVGAKLPTGEIHDGFCFAHEPRDGATRIALFVGFDRVPAKILPTLAGKRSVRTYVVDAETAAALTRRFRPQFDFGD